MIKVNDRWSFERDKWCWVLVEKVPGVKRKTNEPIIVEEETYHRTLDQVCRYIIDKEAGTVDCIVKLMDHITDIHNKIQKVLKKNKEALGNGKG